MKKPVIAIGLDSADPSIVEPWMAQGHLPNLRKLRQQSAYGRLHNTVYYQGRLAEAASTEKGWVMFLTGCLPDKTGYWTTCTYDPADYSIVHGNEINTSYDTDKYHPFYALGEDYRVAVLDMPCTQLTDRVNGIQVLGWGGHFPHTPSHSQPPELYDELQQNYGRNPLLYEDYKFWWDQEYTERIQRDLKVSISRRVDICHDLMQRDNWDLFFTVFGDTHTASHDFWHLSQPDHPLYPHFQKLGVNRNPMLTAFQDVDRAIGDILANAPEDAYIVVFSAHGMCNNGNDMYSMTFLPELLYRFNFPGKVGLAPGRISDDLPPLITKVRRRTWAGEVWQRLYDPNPLRRWLRPWLPAKFLYAGPDADLISPYELHQQDAPLNWMPVTWYRPVWPKMRAFALPNFSDGLIRINLQGREREGIVPASEYNSLCDELTALVHRLRDARTGEPLVRDVYRTRSTGYEVGVEYPEADLVIQWREQPTDVIDSPDCGRIGPFPYYRTGGHRPNGFVMVKGPGISEGTTLPSGHAIDVAPTILSLMGAPIPAHFDGKPLLQPTLTQRATEQLAITQSALTQPTTIARGAAELLA